EQPKGDMTADNGLYDLSVSHTLDGEKIHPLNGEWEFYWKQLLSPEELDQNTINPSYIIVPSLWKKDTINNQLVEEKGYGTYRLQLKIPTTEVGTSKAILVQDISNAYRIWIDGKEMKGLGVVGTSVEE